MTARERAAVIVYDGVAELSAVGPYDVFATAGRHGVPVEASLVTAEPREEIEAIGGLALEPDGTLDPADPPECLFVPSGRWSARASAGAWAEAQRGTVPDAIAGCQDRGSLVAGVGAGSCLMAAAGLGDDPRATDGGVTTVDAASPGAPGVDARIADGGRVATVAGARSGIDLAFGLLERAWGPGPARDVAAMLEYEPDGGSAVG
jgi:transcriptional regulator GlxA family with amidase domain